MIDPRVIAITGHRDDGRVQDWKFVEHQMAMAFRDFHASKVIQGMANGADLRSAVVAYKNRIPFVAARPWRNHVPKKSDEATYDWALKNAAQVKVVLEMDEFPGNWAYQERNKWMVDQAQMVVSVWDGVEGGGTWNTIKYARSKSRVIWNINPRTYQVGAI